jgi:hypothetical protein
MKIATCIRVKDKENQNLAENNVNCKGFCLWYVTFGILDDGQVQGLCITNKKSMLKYSVFSLNKMFRNLLPGICLRRNIAVTNWKKLKSATDKIYGEYFNGILGKREAEEKREGRKANE